MLLNLLKKMGMKDFPHRFCCSFLWQFTGTKVPLKRFNGKKRFYLPTVFPSIQEKIRKDFWSRFGFAQISHGFVAAYLANYLN